MKLKRKCQVIQRLKCYEKEIEKYRHLYDAHIGKREAKRVIELLKRHFKLKPKSINFNYVSKVYGGRAEYNRTISFRRWGLNLGIVCHELCHLFCYKKKIFGHKKEFYDILNEFIIFIENNLEFIIKIK